MSTRKQIALILTVMAVLLLGLGILLAVVLHQNSLSANQPVAEPSVSHTEDESILSDSSQINSDSNTFWAYGREWERLEVPQNYQIEAPPPSADELQPGATTQVQPLVYEKPLLPLEPMPENPYHDPMPFAVNDYIDWEHEYYDSELVTVEEALEADCLILMWDYDLGERAAVQIGEPVIYFRVKDYEPVTVLGWTPGFVAFSGFPFAIRDGKVQSVMLVYG